MAEKIKKGFFKVLPVSVVIFLVLGLVVTFTAPTPQNPGVSPALAASNAIVSITLLDSDSNGKMNKAKVVVDNDVVSATAFIFSTAGWSATNDAGAVAITAVAFDTNADNVGDAATAGTDPLTIIVDLNETNVTANDTLNTDLEILYTQQGINAGTEFDDGANTQLVAITTGDGGGAAVAEADGALPLVYAQVYADTGANGSVETAVLTLTEVVTFTETNADWMNDWAFTANDLTAFAGAPTAMVGTGTNTITFTVTPTVNKTGVSGLTEPQFAFTKDVVNVIADGTANELASIALTSLTDSAIPVRYGNITYSDNGLNGTTDRVTLVYSEKVTYTYADAEWAETVNGLTGFTITACTTCTNVTSLVLTATTTGSITGVSGGVEPQLAYTFATQNISDATGNDAANIGATSLTDGAAPVILTKVYQDSGEDGTVETAVLTLTESVIFTEANLLTDFTFAQENLTGFNGNPSAIAGTGTATMTFTATATADLTGVSGLTEPTLAFTDDAVNHVADATGNNLADFTATALVDDANPVRIGAITYSDNGTNGTTDRVTMSFTEKVTYTYADADWTAVANDLTGFDVTACTTCTDVTSVVLTATTTGSITGVGALGTTPSLDYAFVTQHVADVTGNNLSDFGGGVNLTDGAAPVVLTRVYQDNGANGSVDRAVLTLTEEVTFTESNPAWLNDWAFTANSLTAFAGAPTAMVGTGTATITFTVAATTNLTGVSGLTEPQVAYSTDAVNPVEDIASNDLGTFAVTSLTDAAIPVRYGNITYSDNGTDGSVDRVTLVYTEKVTYTYADAEWVATVNDMAGFDVTACTTCTNVTSLVLTATTTSGAITGVGAGTQPQLAYTFATQNISDATGNDADNIGATSLTDGAAPYLASALYADSDGSGKIDQVLFAFTEVTTWTTITAGDWVFSAAGDVNLAGDFVIGDCVGSGIVATITCTDVDNSSITADANKTGKQTGAGSEPTFTYTQSGANDINDTVNNTANFGPITLVDGAAPRISTAGTPRVTKDTDSVSGAAGTVDGDLDGVLATFTEIMDASSVAGTDFVITLNDDTAKTEAYSDTTDDTTLFFGLSNPTANDTSDLLKLQITGGDGILDVTGVSFAAEGAASAATDGAAPFLVSATYRDLTGTDGAVDTLRTTWTENVTLAHDNAADWSIVLGSINATFSAATVDLVAGTTLDVTITADAGETSSAVAPTIAYDNGDANDSITDSALNATGTMSAVTAADGAAPVILTATFYDADAAPNDGKLDIITVVWSENISAVADDDANWALTSAANFAGIAEGVVECNSGSAAANECDYNFTTTTVKTSVGDLSLAYTAGTSVTDGTNTAASKTITSASSPAFTDAANPVVASTSPADGASGVALDATFSITFSETMTTTDITTTTLGRSPTFTLGSVNGTWTSSDTVVTFAAHEAWAGLQIYTINLVQGSITAVVGGVTLDNSAIVADPYTFTTVAASGGGGGGGGGLPASVSVTTPNGGETLTGGGTYNVTWSAPGVADTINLYYSLDSGINFPNTIATALTNDGSYTWTVPNISSSTVKVKAVSGSLNDISDANLTIAYTTSDISLANSTVEAVPTSVVANGTSFSIVTVMVKDAAGVPLSGKVVSLASSRGTSDTVTTVTGTTGADGKATFNVYSSTAGTSTYTATAQGTVLSDTVSVVFTAVGEPTTPGEGETPTAISVGDLIKSPLSTSVYYYGSDNKRHVFPNEKTYKSWYVDFTGIKSVTASQLQGIALGANVKVRPGTVLVKIDTDPKVYAVEPGGLLRWVPTEARALALYGSAWASRIIDVPLVFWVDYSFGSDITTDQHPTGALIQYTGTTDKYYIQGAERRLVSTAGFTANKFQLSNVLSAPTTISYTLGTPITAEDTALTRIY
jgi:adhesin/invasin